MPARALTWRDELADLAWMLLAIAVVGCWAVGCYVLASALRHAALGR